MEKANPVPQKNVKDLALPAEQLSVLVQHFLPEVRRIMSSETTRACETLTRLLLTLHLDRSHSANTQMIKFGNALRGMQYFGLIKTLRGEGEAYRVTRELQGLLLQAVGGEEIGKVIAGLATRSPVIQKQGKTNHAKALREQTRHGERHRLG